jgi:hypothetical protein
MKYMTKDKTVGIGMIALSALLPVLAILLPINLWMQIWTTILLLPLNYLGYLFIGVVVIAGVGYFYVNSAKIKVNFVFVMVFSGVAAVIILFVPDWFYWVFFA